MNALDQTVARIRSLARDLEKNQWELADELASLGAEEFERGISRLITAAKRPRNTLSIMRTTALAWPSGSRLVNVPFYIHQRYRYRVAELVRAHKRHAIKFGEDNRVIIDTPLARAAAKRAQMMTTISTTIERVVELGEDARVSDRKFREEAMRLLEKWVAKRVA